MSKKGTLIHECKLNLQKQTRYGKSKHADKLRAKEELRKAGKNYEQLKGIYSRNTYNSYDAVCQRFIAWVIVQHGHEIKKYEDCQPFATEWLQLKEDEGLSAFSLHMYSAALACSFNGLSRSELGYVPPARERKNICRNRHAKLDGDYETPNKRNVYKMFVATGARRSELLRLRKEDFREQLDESGKKTGYLEVYKRGKGGKQAYTLVNPKYTEWVREFLQTATTHTFHGEQRLFWKEDLFRQNHQLKAIYAADMYTFYLEHGYGNGKLYHCRKELAGVSYDKGVLAKVSHDLMHARNSVVIQYLWLLR